LTKFITNQFSTKQYLNLKLLKMTALTDKVLQYLKNSLTKLILFTTIVNLMIVPARLFIYTYCIQEIICHIIKRLTYRHEGHACISCPRLILQAGYLVALRILKALWSLPCRSWLLNFLKTNFQGMENQLRASNCYSELKQILKNVSSLHNMKQEQGLIKWYLYSKS